MTHLTRRSNAVRAVLSIIAAAALAGAVAVQPAAAQTQASTDLRTDLTASFAEHTLLAGNATAAIFGNRPAEIQAAQTTLNQNASKIAGLLGTLYGSNANSAFLPLWQRHIQYYADYANSLKAGDASARQQAASNLMQWSVDMGTLLSSPAQFRSMANLSGTINQGSTAGSQSDTQGMLTQMMQQHVMDTMQVIDAQAANNWAQVYSLAAADIRHMKNVADELIKVQGGANTAAYQGANADLKANLAMLLVENAALNANATSAMLNNRMPEYQAASAALQANTAAMSGVLGAVYGGNTYDNVNSVWTNQSLKLAQYANALVNQDVETQVAARANVRGFTSDFVTQFNQSNAQLPAQTINGWGGVLTTNAINLIDAQRAQNFAREYQLRAQTDQYLLQLPEIVGQSINQQFPNQYGIPSVPAVPANIGSVNDNTSIASSNAGTTASTSIDSNNTAGATNAAGDASTANAGTVLLPTTGADLSSSVGQVTGTTTTTDTTGTGASASVTTTTGTTSTTTTGTSASVTDTSTTTSGSVLLPQTGADLSSSVGQVTGTTTTTDTTGTGVSPIVTSTTGTTNTTTTGTSATTSATVTDTSTTSSSSVLLPQTGDDRTQQEQQVTTNPMVPLALIIAGVALLMAIVLMSFASREHGRQKHDE